MIALTRHGQPTIETIINATAAHFALTPEQLTSPRRWRPWAYARFVGMLLARELTSLTMMDIGTAFGGRDHKTVWHGINTATRRPVLWDAAIELAGKLTEQADREWRYRTGDDGWPG